MDEIRVTAAELSAVLAWRDEHKNEVRTLSPFLLSGRIVIEDQAVLAFKIHPSTVSNNRHGVQLRYSAIVDGVPVFMLELHYKTLFGGFCKLERETKSAALKKQNFTDQKIHELRQDILGVFFAVNAYFVYNVQKDEQPPEKVVKHHGTNSKPQQIKNSTTRRLNRIYTIKGRNTPAQPMKKHVITCEGWQVVGHFRHYKNGKVVYIAPFCKGSKAKKQDKKYKV